MTNAVWQIAIFSFDNGSGDNPEAIINKWLKEKRDILTSEPKITIIIDKGTKIFLIKYKTLIKGNTT